MAFRRKSRIVDADGVVGKLLDVTARTHDKPFARVQLSKGAFVEVPFEILEHHAARCRRFALDPGDRGARAHDRAPGTRTEAQDPASCRRGAEACRDEICGREI